MTRADRRDVPSLSELSVCSRSVEKSESSVPSELLPAFLFLRGIAGGCGPTVPIRAAAAAAAGTVAPAGSVAASVAVPILRTIPSASCLSASGAFCAGAAG